MTRTRAHPLAWAALLTGAALLAAPSGAWGASIVTSKHNLSVSGPGSIKAVSETGICIFCHTPHNAAPGRYLWNRDESPVSFYDIYESTTLKAAVGQPSGASKLCLSCHDGTVALGLVRSRATPIAMAGGVTTMPTSSPAYLGSDLRDDHPISFPYDGLLVSQNPELIPPASLVGPVRLDGNDEVQCTSCHDAHDDQFGKFLVMNNSFAALCTTCHQKVNWTISSHATSTRTWSGAPPDPWPHTDYTRVDLNGCENCHRPHSAGHPARLLNTQAEEDNCLPCHNGHVAQTNIDAELLKATSHPVASFTGDHDPTENTVTGPRHVECVDCHNPHVVRSGSASAPLVPDPLKGVTGIDTSGGPVSEAQFEYQICYKCHADSTGKPSPTIPRQFPQDNLRLRFDTGNASYHPVEAAGASSDVPSLLSPYSTSSIIYCTACHSNDNGPGAGGIGPNGPHGSNNDFLLERNLETADNTPESATAYALCYKCHDRQNILDDRSFKKHKKHIENVEAPCTVCHDPHGVATQTHLINFDTRVVSPNAQGNLQFDDLGDRTGRCSLRCHNKQHNNQNY